MLLTRWRLATKCYRPSSAWRLRAAVFQAPSAARAYSDVRKWVVDLTADSIPKAQFQVGFARSSGPGGQHVNKVSTKATIKLDSKDWKAATWIPDEAKAQLNNGFPFMTKTGSIVVQSDLTRSRSDNLADCYNKLVAAIRDTVHIAAEPTEQDLKKWDKVAKRAKEKRLQDKKLRSSKKSSRRSNDFE